MFGSDREDVMGIFSGLSGFGLGGFKDEKIFEDERELSEKKAETHKTMEIPMEEKDFLFEKSYVCPVCDNKFKVPTVRAGKAKLIGQDMDLRPRYQGIDPLKYDAILCNQCGFAAISRGFTNMTSLQMKKIKAQVTSNFKPLPNPGETYTYDDAITRHKIALLCSMVKNGKTSEKAYTCLKIAWMTRSKMETLDSASEEYKQLDSEVKECIANAYEGFLQAFSKESFPMCGMEAMTVTYLIAELARELGKYDEATKMVGKILSGQNVGTRLKEKALTLKEQIKADIARTVEEESQNM